MMDETNREVTLGAGIRPPTGEGSANGGCDGPLAAGAGNGLSIDEIASLFDAAAYRLAFEFNRHGEPVA